MDKEQIKNNLILPQLKKEEELIGYFQAIRYPSFTQYALFYSLFGILGSLLSSPAKVYFVGVTSQGLHLQTFSFLGKPDSHKFIPYAEISKMTFGTGILQAPLRLIFTNGDKLFLNAQIRGAENAAVIDTKTKEFLLSKCN